MERLKNNIKSNAVWLLVLSLSSKAFAFMREVLLAYFFGVGVLLDAYNTGIAFSNTLLFIFSGGAFIPIIISHLISSKGKEENRKLNGFFIVLILLSFVFAFITMFLAPYFVGSSDISEDIILVVRITSFSTVFYALSSIIRAVLNSIDEYRFSGAQDLVMVSIIVLGILISSTGNSLFILSISLLIASLFRVLVQLPGIYKYKKKIEWGVKFDWGGIKYYSLSLFPMVLATTIPQFMVIVTRVISLEIGEGVVSSLSYADRTSELFKSIVAYSLGAVIIAPMSFALAKKKYADFNNLLHKSLVFSFWISTPLFFIFLLWGGELATLLYQRGEFGVEASRMTGIALSCYSISTLLSSPIYILMSAIYTLRDWKVVLRTSTIAVVISIIFMVLTYKWWGVVGVALSIGLYAVLTFILLYSYLSVRFDYNLSYSLMKSYRPILIINLVTFISGYLLYIVNPIFLGLVPFIFLGLSHYTKEDTYIQVKSVISEGLNRYNKV